MADRYTGEVIRLALIADTDATVRDREFADCQINGPAVMVAHSCEFTNCGWDGEPESLFWEIPPPRSLVIGAVLVQGCRFIGCRFSGVGIAGPPDAIAKWRKGLTG
jgi:hypothetical protein